MVCLSLFFFGLLFLFFDVFFCCFLFCFFLLFMLFGWGGFWFGGPFFLDGISFFLVFLTVVVFLFCLFSRLLDL